MDTRRPVWTLAGRPPYNCSMTESNSKADILVLSSAIGSGHMRASAALALGVGLVDPERTCSIVDFPHEVSPAVEDLIRRTYLESLKLMPDLYGKLYRMSETRATQQSTPSRTSELYERWQQFSEQWAAKYDPSQAESGTQEPRPQLRDRMAMRALDRLIEQTGARALVAPHFYGASALGRYKELYPDAFTSVVLTDYVPHPLGVPDNLDLYIVADDAAAATVEKIGVPADRIHPTGIPIDPAFELPADVQGVRRDVLEFPEDDEDDLPVVIVMGGGLGGGHLENVVTSLLEASPAMHLVVLCGSNTRDRERLQAIAQARGRTGTFLSFTDRVRDLMAASHVLVTKPGGMTCTESLASGLPQVLFNPIPGQEEDNAAAMVRYGAGVMVNRTEDILGATMKILTSGNYSRRMRDSARAAHHPNSARTAAELLLERIP
jgi:processive 1,2-diacylglycerol beta-glucosyltransferase